MQAMLDRVRASWGVGPTTVINNAGVSRTALALDATEDDFDVITETNLKGVWNVAQLAAKEMVRDGVEGGAIVNIASILGVRPARGLSLYAASKGAVIQLTRALACELGPKNNIRVNALCPGYIRTEINADFFDSPKGKEFVEKRIPSKRLGLPQDLDGAMLLLASDAGSFINGTTLVVDGGHVAGSL